MFEKMLKFSIEFDDFSNGASIAKPNTVPMFFVFFDFQVNLFFDFFYDQRKFRGRNFRVTDF